MWNKRIKKVEPIKIEANHNHAIKDYHANKLDNQWQAGTKRRNLVSFVEFHHLFGLLLLITFVFRSKSI